MAKLNSGKLSLEINYKSFDFGEVTYEIGFLWNGESMVNDALLKRSSEWWSSRQGGMFLANDMQGDSLITMIARVLESGDACYWVGDEPDVVFAIYPDVVFPFFHSHRQLLEREMVKGDLINWQQPKSGEDKSPSNYFWLILLVDTYNFEKGGYIGQGLSLQMITERSELENFHLQLKAEFLDFKEKFRLVEHHHNHELAKIEDYSESS